MCTQYVSFEREEVWLNQYLLLSHILFSLIFSTQTDNGVIERHSVQSKAYEAGESNTFKVHMTKIVALSVR